MGERWTCTRRLNEIPDGKLNMGSAALWIDLMVYIDQETLPSGIEQGGKINEHGKALGGVQKTRLMH